MHSQEFDAIIVRSASNFIFWLKNYFVAGTKTSAVGINKNVQIVQKNIQYELENVSD